MESKNSLVRIFSEVEDPRSHINRLHNLTDVIAIGMVAVLCGAETWEQMVAFSKSKIDFLLEFLELPHGIPSKDTINRVFSTIDSIKFEACFLTWVNTISDLSTGQVIAIDGKTIRGAKEHGKTSPIHMVSAWACENNLVLGQIKVNEKSNEITAIPELLEMLCVENCVVTIDAMGCQRDIAESIIKNDANYILAVKGNQGELYQDIQDSFVFSKKVKTVTDVDFGHGRIETRTCSVIKDLSRIQKSQRWENLTSLVKLESMREFKNSTKPTETFTRYFISSCDETEPFFQKSIRSHWAIENKLHWVLDVAFGEDASRKRKGNAAQNYSLLLKIALNLLKNEKTEKQSIKSKRLKSAWDIDYLRKVMKIKV